MNRLELGPALYGTVAILYLWGMASLEQKAASEGIQAQRRAELPVSAVLRAGPALAEVDEAKKGSPVQVAEVSAKADVRLASP